MAGGRFAAPGKSVRSDGLEERLQHKSAVCVDLVSSAVTIFPCLRRDLLRHPLTDETNRVLPAHPDDIDQNVEENNRPPEFWRERYPNLNIQSIEY